MQYEWYKKGQDLLNEMNQAQFPEDMIGIWFLGQESLAIKYRDKLLWMDPFFTDLKDPEGNSTRTYAPPFRPAEIMHADYIFGSHDHIDHIDVDTLGPMAANSPEARIIVPAPHIRKLQESGIPEGQIIAAKGLEEIRLADDILVTPIPAAHEIYEEDENGNHKHLSYIVQLGKIRLFHAGDMVWADHTLEHLAGQHIDVACLPINGADPKRRNMNLIGNMNAREAADLADAIHADVVIPLHYDMFAHNAENPAIFADYMYRYYRDHRYHILAHGECYLYHK